MFIKVCLFTITFLLIYGWKITGFIDISATIASILAIRLLFQPQLCHKLKTDLSVKSLYFLTIYSIVLSIFTGIEDIQIILRALRAFIMLIASFSLYDIYSRKTESPREALISDTFYSILAHSMLMISMFYSDSLRNTIYSVTDAASYVNNSSSFLDGYRICGLTYGLSQTSVLQMFDLLLLPTMIKKSCKQLSKILLLATTPIILTSVLISGRSGAFIGIILLPVYFICKSSINRKTSSKTTGISFHRGIVYILLLVLFALITFEILPDKFHQYTMNTSNEVFEALNFEGHTMTEVSEHMYFFPDNLAEMLLGTGNFGRTDYNYIESDVGWVRSIFAIGIIGLVLMLIPYLSAIITAFKNRNSLGEIAFAAILIFLASLLLNCKELAILTRNQWTIQAILLAILVNRES